MYQYFPNNYTWSLAVMSALNRGGQIAEIDEACRPLHEAAGKKALDGDVGAQNAWFESWCRMAGRVERLGQADEAAGHPLSAGRKYLRVGLYYQLAERMPSHKDPRRLVAYKKGVAAYKKGLELRKEPVEFVQVPYGDTTLPAIFMKAPGKGPTPCMVHFNGLDLTKEIVYAAIGDEFRRRGVSLLIVDHPGVGAALRLQNLYSGPDTEKPAGACMDYLETRQDVDAKRVGIIALSLGGYYAPRAAAFEKRFACCVAWGAIFDYGVAVQSRMNGNGEPSVPGFGEHLNWVFGKEKFADTLEVVKQMSLEHIADKITCPLLVVHGENDRQIPLWHAERTIAAAVNSQDRTLKVFSLFDGGTEHCGADNSTMVVDYMTDWVAERLGAAVAGV
ncbi:MAG: prolyl oligopeptidase family serine peptidase [Pseudomonadota bacterium]